MGDTVVCDNSENALMINRNNNRQQRNRVVTQDGELYERGGSLTGGGVTELLHRFKGFTYDAYTQQTQQHDLEKKRQALVVQIDALSS